MEWRGNAKDYSLSEVYVCIILSQVFLYPLETCSESLTCDECVSSFPLCGWCTVENKCSRVSQCLDSSQTGRWVQESDQCITTIVTPDQFILAAPTIVRANMFSTYIIPFFQLNVSASPGLPGGLTYNCFFSGSGATMLAPAIEVVAGSQYQCDLTDTLIALDRAKDGRCIWDTMYTSFKWV